MKAIVVGLVAAGLAASSASALEVLTKDKLSSATTAITGMKMEMDELKKLTNVQTVKIVTIDSALSADSQMTAAMTASQADLVALRAALEANAKVKAQLDTDKVTIDKVVGVDVATDGTVTIYAKA